MINLKMIKIKNVLFNLKVLIFISFIKLNQESTSFPFLSEGYFLIFSS